MALSLYDATVPSMLQLLVAGQGLLNKAEASDFSEEDIADARLIDDMLPFAYQIKSMWTHSKLAFDGAKSGLFSPEMSDPPSTYAGMRAKLVEAEAALKELTPDAVEALADGETIFRFRDFEMPFTTPNFLLSFSQPNFYFHAATAYDILRAKGLEIGKRDFLGPIRLKQG